MKQAPSPCHSLVESVQATSFIWRELDLRTSIFSCLDADLSLQDLQGFAYRFMKMPKYQSGCKD
ncbi:hypothetical protein KUF71_001869 [Frankliniella fusca]|uniref:Uncharacterized protein n=1 Tax=Frankliniella fusca TaxID=407009 RepID=A0AAE1HMM4_9NEOP|nr:hypothetical protein KUF71_001869 [Frankliniella fusca]